MNIDRTDNNGKFELKLSKYLSNHIDYLEKDATLNKQRKLHFSFEAKKTGNGSHNLEIVVKDNDNGHWISSRSFPIEHEEWKKKDAYFRIANTKNFYFRFDNKQVTTPPSSVQIRNVRLIERI